MCIYVFGCKLSLVRLCDCDFGITPVDDIAIGITCAAFYYYHYYYQFPAKTGLMPIWYGL